MTLFSLPPSLPSLPSPLNEAPAFADLAAAAAEAERTIEEKDPCSEATSALRGELTLVGSDWRPLALHAARHRLRAFCDFYFDGATPMDPEEQLQTNALGKPLPIANNGQGKKTPFALSFHLCTPFEVAPFLSGAFVLTRIPDTRDMKVCLCHATASKRPRSASPLHGGAVLAPLKRLVRCVPLSDSRARAPFPSTEESETCLRVEATGAEFTLFALWGGPVWQTSSLRSLLTTAAAQHTRRREKLCTRGGSVCRAAPSPTVRRCVGKRSFTGRPLVESPCVF